MPDYLVSAYIYTYTTAGPGKITDIRTVKEMTVVTNGVPHTSRRSWLLLSCRQMLITWTGRMSASGSNMGRLSTA